MSDLNRMQWEDDVFSAIEQRFDVSRSDAQAIARDDLLEYAFNADLTASQAVDFIAAATDADMTTETTCPLALPLLRHIEKQGTTVTIVDANGETVATFEHQRVDGRNAAEIVRRVNMHDDLIEALRSIATGICRFDVLNPCWAGRPGDVAGKHWGGGPACPECRASAILAKVDQKEGR